VPSQGQSESRLGLREVLGIARWLTNVSVAAVPVMLIERAVVGVVGADANDSANHDSLLDAARENPLGTS